MPFLLGDRLVARVDVKADRAAGVLRVPGAFAEANVDAGRIALPLAAELAALAAWLGLDAVAVSGDQQLAVALARTVGPPSLVAVGTR